MNYHLTEKQCYHIMAHYLDHKTIHSNIPGSYWVQLKERTNYPSYYKCLGIFTFIWIGVLRSEILVHIFDPKTHLSGGTLHLDKKQLLQYALTDCPQYLTFRQIWLSFIMRK